MNQAIFSVLGLLIIIPVLIAFYIDCKNNPKEFTTSLKSPKNRRLLTALIFLVIYFGLVKIWQFAIPLEKENGIEFNAKREKLGIPIIGTNWKMNQSESKQFETYWWKPEPRNGHFKKVISSGIFNAKTETDYYQNIKQPGTFAWSVYDFKNKAFEYFIEKPNPKITSITKSGNIKRNNPTIVSRVNKSEFDNYIVE